MSNPIKVPSPAAPLVLDGGVVNQTVWYTFFEQLAAQQGVTGDYLGKGGSGQWSAAGFQIKHLADPTDPQDAVTLAYYNAHLPVVPTSIHLDAGAWDADHIRIKNVADPINLGDAVNYNFLRNYVLGSFLPFNFTDNKWDAGTYVLENIGAPTFSDDAMPLGYFNSHGGTGTAHTVAAYNASSALSSNPGLSSTVSGQWLFGVTGSANGQISILGPGGVGLTNVVAQAAAGTVTFSLPPNNGTLGYLLETDGAGNTSWVPPPTSGLPWNAIDLAWDAQTHRIENVGAPTTGTDAATKTYVDENDDVYYWHGVADASGTGGTDNTASLQAAINYCAINNKILFIGSDTAGGTKYRLTGPITINSPIDIRCDNRVILWWSGLSSGTHCLTLTGTVNWWTSIELPYLAGPAITNITTFTINFAALSTTANGVILLDIYWTKVKFNNMQGFNSALTLRATSAFCGNHLIDFLIIENCYRGVVISSQNTFPCSDNNIRGNAINCQANNIYFSVSGVSFISNSNISIDALYSIGSSNIHIYGSGAQVNYCNVTASYVGFKSDGTDGSPITTCQIVGGNVSGGFGGSGCHFKLPLGTIYNGGYPSGVTMFAITGTNTTVASVNGDDAPDVIDVVSFFGADPTGNVDAQPFFTAATTFCQNNNKTLYIPGGTFKFGSRWTITGSLNVESCRTAILDWSGAFGNAGIEINNGFNNKHCRLNLPELRGPYYAMYVGTTMTLAGWANVGTEGSAAVKLTDTYWVEVNIEYAGIWSKLYWLRSSTNNQGVQNNQLTWNTADVVYYGIYADSATGTTGSFIGPNQIYGNTHFGVFNIYLNGTYAQINVVDINIQQTWIDIQNGYTVYGVGTNIFNCRIEIQDAHNANDASSPVGTPVFQGPHLGGNQTVNGNTNCFAGQYCSIAINPANGTPAAGNPILYRLGGWGSQIDYVGTKQRTSTPVALVAAAGEAGFNGGVGGALIDKYVPVQFTLAANLNAQAQITLYCYHQAANSAISMPIQVASLPAYLGAYVVNNAFTIPREIVIYIRNLNTIAITAGTTITFFLVMP